MAIGKLEPVNLREMFKDEAYDFSPWLQDNIEVLSERLGIELTATEREKKVGSFSLDLLAEGPGGVMAIVENQLECTDHDHLGKVLTYLVNLDAKVAIWITPEVRPEHMRVFQWLNENTPEDVLFYLVQVEAFRIGASEAAPLFTTLVAPSATGKAVAGTTKDLAARHVKRREFWKRLLEKSKGRTHLFENISPSIDNWISSGIGKGGFWLSYVLLMDRAVVEIDIDHDTTSGRGNLQSVEELMKEKDAIEAEAGGPLLWDQVEGRRMCKIMRIVANVGLKNTEMWGETQDKMIEAMIRLDKAFRPRVAELKL